MVKVPHLMGNMGQKTHTEAGVMVKTHGVGFFIYHPHFNELKKQDAVLMCQRTAEVALNIGIKVQKIKSILAKL